MNIIKKSLLDAGSQGIIGFEMTISSYFFNVNKANDQLNKVRNKRYDVDYIIDEWQESQSEFVEETDELQILQGTLQELITEEERLTKEIDNYYCGHDETNQRYGDFYPYSHLYSDSRSLS